MIEANGWVLRLDVTGGLGDFASYILDPDGTPRLTLASSHPGFIKSGGQAVAGTIARSLVGTKPLRRPIPAAGPITPVIDETDLGGGVIRVRIALSEHVYATDTGVTLAVLAGWRAGESAATGIRVTNASTIVTPIPIMRWVLLPYGVTTGAFTVALFVASHHPVGFEPVAGVKFTATDGTTIKTVWTTQLSTDASYGDGLRCYTATIDPATATALTAGLLRIDAEVHPWLGGVRTTDPAGTRSMATLRSDGASVAAEAPFVIGHDPAGTRYNGHFAFVDSINGTTTAAAAMVQPSLAAARAVAPAARPRSITTALAAMALVNRTLPEANGQAAQARSADGFQIVLAAGTHTTGTTGIIFGIGNPEIPVRISGDPADSNPRARCIVQTSGQITLRVSRSHWSRLRIEIGSTVLCSMPLIFVDDCEFVGKAGQETNSASPFSAAPAAGQWGIGMVRSLYWRTGSSLSAGSTRLGLMRACETARPVGSVLAAVKNRVIPALEDGFTTPWTNPNFGAWPAPTLAGQVEDIIIAFNDLRSSRGRICSEYLLPAALAGTPNPSLRRMTLLGNVVERIGTHPEPLYGFGEDSSATMSYNIIEANSFIGERSNTFHSDPLPATLGEAGTLANQAFCNRIAGNVFDWLPTKHDQFNDPTTAALRGGGSATGYRPHLTEAWSMLYGVGHEANVDLRRVGGTDDWRLEYHGRRSVSGAAAAPLDPHYSDDRSAVGNDSGGGNYRPLAISPVAARAVRGNGDTDADGQTRRVPFAAGAFQTVAVALVPSGARCASRVAPAALNPATVLLPETPRHDVSGSALLGWSGTLAPTSGQFGHTVAAPSLSTFVLLAPDTAALPQRAAAIQLGLAIALAPATASLLFVGTATALLQTRLATIDPDAGGMAFSAAAPLLLPAAARARATVVIAPDPRTVFPNRN